MRGINKIWQAIKALISTKSTPKWLLSCLLPFAIFAGILQATATEPIPQTPPPTNSNVGAGLYEKKCVEEERKKIDKIEENKDEGKIDTTYVTYKETVCTLVPIAGKYPITECDSLWNMIEMDIDTIHEGQESVPNPEGGPGFVTVDKYRYDTTKFYAFEVHCRQVDTTYTYDTIKSRYCLSKTDTSASRDSVSVYGPAKITDTTMTFDPHVFSTYKPYTDFTLRSKDSIQALLAKLNALLAKWPKGLREAVSLDDQFASVVNALPPGVTFTRADTIRVRDSLKAIVPITPAYYRAWIAALEAAMAQLKDEEKTNEYHIDSVRVKVIVHMPGGQVVTDTITIRTIPMLYTRQPDTGLRYDREVALWAASPDLPDGSGKYANITWYPPVNKLGQVVNPAKGFNPNVTPPYGNVALTDSTHIRTLLGQGGVNDFLANAPHYIADTLDGDTLYFPIKVEATPELKAKYPHAPDYLCSIYDTIKVAIIKGVRINGFVSYASLWMPSVLTPPDTRSTDQPFDADVVRDQPFLKHRAIGNATVLLFDMAGNFVDSARSDVDGYFSMGFKQKYYPAGKYRITARSPHKRSVYSVEGMNGADAVWVSKYVAIMHDRTLLPEVTNPRLSMWWWASNVNLTVEPYNTLGLDGEDATKIQDKVARRLGVTQADNFFKDKNNNTLEDWVYSTDTLDLTSDTMHHVRGVMRGDADRSYFDDVLVGRDEMRKGRKITKAAMAKMGKVDVYEDERILDFPVLSVSEGHIGGFQLFLYFNTDKVEPLSVRMPSKLNPQTSNLAYNVIDDEILTTWITKDRPYFHNGDTILMLRFKLSGNLIKNVGSYFKNDLVQYVVSDTNARIVPWDVAMPQLRILEALPKDSTDDDHHNHWNPLFEEGDTIYLGGDETGLVTKSGNTDDDHNHDSHIISVIPNPISTWGDASYHVGESCLVNLKLYSLLGENVLTFVEGERQQGLYRISMNMQSLPSGVYILRLETLKEGRMGFDFVKVIIRR